MNKKISKTAASGGDVARVQKKHKAWRIDKLRSDDFAKMRELGRKMGKMRVSEVPRGRGEGGKQSRAGAQSLSLSKRDTRKAII